MKRHARRASASPSAARGRRSGAPSPGRSRGSAPAPPRPAGAAAPARRTPRLPAGRPASGSPAATRPRSRSPRRRARPDPAPGGRGCRPRSAGSPGGPPGGCGTAGRSRPSRAATASVAQEIGEQPVGLLGVVVERVRHDAVLRLPVGPRAASRTAPGLQAMTRRAASKIWREQRRFRSRTTGGDLEIGPEALEDLGVGAGPGEDGLLVVAHHENSGGAPSRAR